MSERLRDLTFCDHLKCVIRDICFQLIYVDQDFKNTKVSRLNYVPSCNSFCKTEYIEARVHHLRIQNKILSCSRMISTMAEPIELRVRD